MNPAETPLEKFVRLRKEREEYAFKYLKEMEDVIQEIKEAGCPHSITSEFTWEHDNGYGHQERLKGIECDICGFRDHYLDGRFIDPGNVSY